MDESKKFLHEMIDGITSDGVAECLATFIGLWLEKWGGVAK